MMGCAWNMWGSCGRPKTRPLRAPPGAPSFSPRLPSPTNLCSTPTNLNPSHPPSPGPAAFSLGPAIRSAVLVLEQGSCDLEKLWPSPTVSPR